MYPLHSTASFDLDGDMINDIKFQITKSSSPCYLDIYENAYSLNNIQFIAVPTNTTLIDSVPVNRIIDNNLNWTNLSSVNSLFSYSRSCMPFSVYSIGSFMQSNNYLAFRKISTVDTIYGWIHLDCKVAGIIKIMDWAYENKCLNQQPISASSSSSTSCESEAVTITANGAISYTWSTGSTGSSITVSPTATTTYTVEGTDLHGCTINASITQSVVNSPTLTVNSSTNVSCESEPVTINVNGADSYNWSTGNTGPSITVSPTVTTTYTVEGTNLHGCAANAVITQSVASCVGIREYDVDDIINIYPNPVSTILHFADERNDLKNAKLEIRDYSGRMVLKQTYADAIDVSTLSNGFYFIQISSKTHRYHSKFMKQ